MTVSRLDFSRLGFEKDWNKSENYVERSDWRVFGPTASGRGSVSSAFPEKRLSRTAISLRSRGRFVNAFKNSNGRQLAPQGNTVDSVAHLAVLS